MSITINLTKAKDIAHEMRRQVRAEEFAPLDVKATIPSEAESAELARQQIRDKYTEIQNNIDAAQEVSSLKTIVEQFK